ncbi:MAG: hypothetical protein CO128_10410 [Ignavibacteriales bacterium CG_4_9_14_3_um_filter_30_11]|nr:MAG: hypothetical protein CO128_10410 [Ignavibacteriales bacterium CG_4_9_14_3_um_filter_30_11]
MKLNKLFIILTFISTYGCNSIIDSSDNDTLTQKTVFDNGIEYTLTIGKNVFSITDSLYFNFSVKNVNFVSKTFNFNNYQQLGFKLTNESNEVFLFYPWVLSPALSSFILEPKQTKEYLLTRPFKNHLGNYINRGNYTLSVFLLNKNFPEVTLKLSVL